jgi:glutamate/aspartate transport system substrate-binding protein
MSMKPLRLLLPSRAAAMLAAVLLACGVTPRDATAQFTDERGARALTGVLKRIKETGVVRIGYRESAIPFSYRGAGGQPYGYSIDLCREIVADLTEAVGLARLRTEYVVVTPADRIEQVRQRRIELECGATTNTAARREFVSFSPVIFVAGTQLLVARSSRIRSLRDLEGRTVVVARGTANEEVIRGLLASRFPGVQLKVVEDYDAALSQLAAGAAAALAADDVLLYSYVAEHGLQRQFAIVGELLSYDTYGIMYANGDAALAEVVRAALTRLAKSREIRVIYNTWFLRPLPSGVLLGLPMSPQLERNFQLLGLPVD